VHIEAGQLLGLFTPKVWLLQTLKSVHGRWVKFVKK